MKHPITHRRGSALLIALVIMGILLTLALGVSELLLGTIKDSRLLLEQTSAWYAAEGGIERALAEISDHKPGYENVPADMTLENIPLAGSQTTYTYSVVAAGTCMPITTDGLCPEDPNNETNTESFAELELNESIVIPLFNASSGLTDEDNPSSGDVHNFTVEYYLPREIAVPLKELTEQHLPNSLQSLGDFDVLRWKIFGSKQNNADPTQSAFEVINEFSPSVIPGANDAIVTQNNPACISTNQTSNCWTHAKYYDRTGTPDTTTTIENYPIEEFLRTHTNNFLVLSNYINPTIIAATDESKSFQDRLRLSKIRYRVFTNEGDTKFTLPKIRITAQGKIGTTKESIDLVLDRDRFLPVFNFALYRTADEPRPVLPVSPRADFTPQIRNLPAVPTSLGR